MVFRVSVQCVIFVCKNRDQIIVSVTVQNCVMLQVEIYMACICESAFWTL